VRRRFSTPRLMWPLLRDGDEWRKNMSVLHHGIQELVDAKKEVMRTKPAGEEADLLEIMLEFKAKEGDEGFSDKELFDEVLQFWGSGYETTGRVLSNTVQQLAQNPLVLSTLQRELDDVMGDSDVVTWAMLSQLKYLDAVMKEVLRHRPIAILMRETTRTIELAGYQIPAKTMIAVPTYALHSDPTYWERPDEFWPERWLQEGFHPVPGSYVPFGEGGPKMCLGQRIALTTVKVMISRMIKIFDFKETPGVVTHESAGASFALLNLSIDFKLRESLSA